MPAPNNLFNNYSSRIKKVLIELQNYSFFHGPSEIGSIDKRFIGRKNLIRKFKSILNFSETQSGTYLITGYRGMGKSSFVSKVISELTKTNRGSQNIIFKLVVLFFSLVLISISFLADFVGIVLVFLLISLFYLLTHNRNEYDKRWSLKNSWNNRKNWRRIKNWNFWQTKIFESLRKTTKDAFLFKGSTNQNKKTYSFFQFLFRLSFLFTISYIGTNLLDNKKLHFHFLNSYSWFNLTIAIIAIIQSILITWYVGRKTAIKYLCENKICSLIIKFVILVIFLSIFYLDFFLMDSFLNLGVSLFLLHFFLYIVLLNIIEWYFSRLGSLNEDKSKKGKYTLKELRKPIIAYFDALFNYSQKIFIKINLGYSGLQEADMLRLIAKNIKSKYSEVNKFIGTRFLWKFLIVIIAFLLTGILYYNDAVYISHKGVKENRFVGYYFPSQYDQILRNEQKLLTDITLELKEKGLYKKENLIYIINEFNYYNNTVIGEKIDTILGIYSFNKHASKLSFCFNNNDFGKIAAKMNKNPKLFLPEDRSKASILLYYNIVADIQKNRNSSEFLTKQAIFKNRIPKESQDAFYILEENLVELEEILNKVNTSTFRLLKKHFRKSVNDKIYKHRTRKIEKKIIENQYFVEFCNQLLLISELYSNLNEILKEKNNNKTTIYNRFDVSSQYKILKYFSNNNDDYKHILKEIIRNNITNIHLVEFIEYYKLKKLPISEIPKHIEAKKNLYKKTLEIDNFKNLDTLINSISMDSILHSQSINELKIIPLLKYQDENPEQSLLIKEKFDSILTPNILNDFDRVMVLYDSVNHMSKLKSSISHFTTITDLFIYNNYSYLRENWMKFFKKTENPVRADQLMNMNIRTNDNISFPFMLIPYHLDYIFILYFIIIWRVLNYLLSLGFLGYTTKKKIFRKLDNLNDSIEAYITTETSRSVGDKSSIFNFMKSKSKTRPIADIREIEKELIEIISLFKKLPILNERAEFVFIFDELDKIYPHRDVVKNQNENNNHNDEEISSKGAIFYSPEGTRNRQHTVLNLLSNLKYFLTTAKSKFIFIAGREMYDAYLADVSDRNFVIGSIFHEVLYVNSFLTESTESNHSDITSMTEEYICQFIIPPDYALEGYNLNSFNKYLISQFKEEFDENIKTSETEKIIARQKREMVIHLLQNFITYLTHISSGAPNKITSYFENYVTNLKNYEINELNCLYVGRSSKSLYISLDYYNQYKINVLNYLLTPINIAIADTINSVRSIGDKLLVSTSFVIDHLLKFHKFGFSWRNIDSTPEILDISKSSELRDFINKIIIYLSNTHIEEIISGLYSFKFPKKISQEIGFLSKVSEEAAAIFNFILDESLAVKQYYQKVLNNLIAQRENVEVLKVKLANHYHSISAVHLIVGDLHFYDEDYGAAIISYLESVQILRNIPTKKLTVDLMAVLVRNMLKLGLALEKRKTYNSAFLTYGEVATMVIKFGNTNYSDGSDYTIINDNLEDASFNKKIKGLVRNINPKKEKIIYKVSSYEGLKLYYQPILARFQIMEKSHLGGVTKIDLKRLEAEFFYLHKSVISKEKFLLYTEFWNKVADVLYLKNHLTDEYKLICSNKLCENRNILTLNKNGSCKHGFITNQNKIIGKPCEACQYYEISLINLIQYFIGKKIQTQNLLNESLNIVLENLNTFNFSSTRVNNFKALANLLSDYGDLLLSCISVTNKSKQKEFFNADLDYITYIISSVDERNKSDKNKPKMKGLNVSNKILMLFYLSGIFYKKAGEHKLFSLQLTKILYTVRLYLNITKIDIRKNEEEYKKMIAVLKTIAQNSIRSLYQAYDNIHNYEIERYKNIFNRDTDNFTTPGVSLNRGSIYTELNEIIFLIKNIELRCGNANIQKEYLSGPMLSPYNLVSNMYNRMIELRYKVLLNYKIANNFSNKLFDEKLYNSNKIGIRNQYILNILSFLCNFENNFTKIYNSKNKQKTHETIISNDIINRYIKLKGNTQSKKFEPNNQDKFNLLKIYLEFIITDSIFCLHEVIKLLNIYGRSFTMNHTFAANTHKRLMDWSELYHSYLATLEHISEVAYENGCDSILKNRFHWKDKQITQLKCLLRTSGNLDKKHFKKTNKNIYNVFLLNKMSKLNNESNVFPCSFKTDLKFLEYSIKISHLINGDFLFEKNITSNITKDLSILIEPNNLPFITPSYQAERAIKEYYMAIETHSEGKAYKNLLAEMFYLNDDYNDKMYHFSVATERFQINSGDVHDTIKNLKKRVKRSVVYEYDTYIETKIKNEN